MATLRRAISSLSRVVNLTVASRHRSSFPAGKLCKPQFMPVTYRFYTTEIDLADAESRRRLINRLLYRSKQRGFLELDLVLGKWVEENINSMDENGIKSLVQILDVENPDLWQWLSGQEQPPESISVNPVFSALREKIANALNSYSVPDTRATPGKPWVRGWDDIKRGEGISRTGNQ